MAITATILQPSNQGKGPVPHGNIGEEDWQLTGDGASTTIVVTAKRLRKVNYAQGATSYTVSGKTATFTFATAPANGALSTVKLFGQGR